MMGTNKLIKEDLNRFNQIMCYNLSEGLIKEDTQDIDGYHSQDPAQLDMFTQLAGDEREQLKFKFIKDNNIPHKLDMALSTTSELSTEWEKILEPLINIYRENQKVIEGDNDLDVLYQDIEHIAFYIDRISTMIFELKDRINK